jgi:hypothetical protein
MIRLLLNGSPQGFDTYGVPHWYWAGILARMPMRRQEPKRSRDAPHPAVRSGYVSLWHKDRGP